MPSIESIRAIPTPTLVLGAPGGTQIVMGVLPSVFLRPMEPAVQRMVERMQSRQQRVVSVPAAVPSVLTRKRSGEAGRPRAEG